ncbi:MAG: hypothetical protein MZV63_13630 [Marinilabiliales bacterium]|nr:hypothetical protein [Marinilabiliales bacterium]
MGPNGHERTAHGQRPVPRGSRIAARRTTSSSSPAPAASSPATSPAISTNKGFTRIRAVDKKPLYEWYLRTSRASRTSCLDVERRGQLRQRVCEGAVEVYNLAADMGGMGFIERFRVECLRSILINTHMVEAAYQAGAAATSSPPRPAPTTSDLQQDPNVARPQGIRRLPGQWPSAATAGRSSSPRSFCQEYWAERGLKTAIARFHNVYGPLRHLGRRPREGPRRALRARSSRPSTTADRDIDDLGRRHARPAASCISTTASKGIDMIMHCDELDRHAHQPGLAASWSRSTSS